jgi:hypothetical protein
MIVKYMVYGKDTLFILQRGLALYNIGVGVCRRNRYRLMGCCGEDNSNEALASGCFRKSLNA